MIYKYEVREANDIDQFPWKISLVEYEEQPCEYEDGYLHDVEISNKTLVLCSERSYAEILLDFILDAEDVNNEG